MTEEKYTLAEAKQILATRACNMWGHTDLQEIHGSRGVVSIVCNDCGARYKREGT